MNAATLYRRGHRLTRTAGALGLCLLLSAAFLGCSQPAPPPIPPTPENSAELSSTAIVPTLDTPLPENKSALWCCTFQMAWDELKTDVVKEPIRLGGAEEVAERLNKNEFSPGNLTEGSYYKTAGYNRDGVHDRIRQEMNRRFPGEPVIGLGDNPPIGFTAFAFL